MRQWPDNRLLAECRLETFRASGRGGQKRNKTRSAVRLVHLPSLLEAIANESRSQIANRRMALRRLRHRLALQLRQPIDLPGDNWQIPQWFQCLRPALPGIHYSHRPLACLSSRHELYPAAMGLLLDVLAAVRWSISDAAAHLECSTAALVRFLEADGQLWAHVNQHRAAAALKPLRTT